MPRILPCVALSLFLTVTSVAARTVYRCVHNGTVSVGTAPEPGSNCEPKVVEDNPVEAPNPWGNFGVFSGTLYEREQEGVLVYSTRNLPGSRVYLKFTVATPPGEPAHEGLGHVGAPQVNRHAKQFRAAAKATGVDDVWLRAIAHAESAFDETALSPKGAQGVMQLIPEVSVKYGVKDPFSAAQSINGGARHIKVLLQHYSGDRSMAAAAYNAGIGTVAHYRGVPPYELRHKSTLAMQPIQRMPLQRRYRRHQCIFDQDDGMFQRVLGRWEMTQPGSQQRVKVERQIQGFGCRGLLAQRCFIKKYAGRHHDLRGALSAWQT